MLSKTVKPQELKVRAVSAYDDYIPDFYRVFECKSDNVVEELTPEVDFWTSRDPVLIQAQPGKGKTTFANEIVVRRAVQSGKNALIISNRVAVSVQQKLKIMDLIQSPLIGMLTDEGIRKRERFGAVSVITYHRLPAFLKDPENQVWIRNLLVVVADEIHLVASDAFFNPQTGYYLKLVTSMFQHAIRIYMTATPEDVLTPLAEAEHKNYRDFQKVLYGAPSREFRYYRFTPVYDHINLQFFESLDEISEMIHEEANDQWLVFVASKAEGKAFAKELGKRALYLDAESKDTQEWNDLLKTSNFGQQVLVTTAVLDSGANIWASKLRHVVIMTDNKTSLIQMLGRKRCSPKERVNLYVKNLDMKLIGKRQKDYQELCQWHDRYTEATAIERHKMAVGFWRDKDDALRLFFGLTHQGNLVPNNMAFFALRRRMLFYESILEGKTTFEETVRSWLGMPEEAQETPQDKLFRFCENHEDSELDEEEIIMFRKLVVNATKQAGFSEPQPGRIESLGRGALNNRLEKLNCPYALARNEWKIKLTEE